VETVIGQLAERFQIEKGWARETWHQFSSFWRKLLAHTVSVKVNLSIGNKPLQFEQIIILLTEVFKKLAHRFIVSHPSEMF